MTAVTPSQVPDNVEIIRSPRRKRTIQARVHNGTIVVRVPAGMPADEEAKAVADVVAKINKKRTAGPRSDADLTARAEQLNRDVLEGRAQMTSIRWVGNQNTRWGSCSTASGAIRISDRLQHVPDYVVDVVIVHELVHTFIPDHSKEFWEWANRAPKAERAAGYLEAYGRWGSSS